MTMAAAPLFHLASLASDAATSDPFLTNTLDKINPRFVLPTLDERDSATNRLLASLNGQSSYDKQALSLPADWSGNVEKTLPLHTDMDTDNGDDEHDEHDGLWQRVMEDEAGPSRPRPFQPLRTWDMDSLPVPTKSPTPFLSERGPFAFDHLLTTLEPPNQIPKLSSTANPAAVPPIASRTMLEIMLRSTLGTLTTDQLTWDSKRCRYRWSDARPIGIERITATSAVQRLLRIGTAIRRLDIIVNSQSSLPLTPTHHALFHALSTYLTFIKQRLTSAIEQYVVEDKASWNKWISATKDVRLLAELLCEVMNWPLGGSSAEALPPRPAALLTHLYSHLLSVLSTSSPKQQHSPVPLALAYLLSHASNPFLLLLYQWVGLSDSSALDEDPDPSSQPWADLGITRTPLTGEEWRYSFSSRRMPAFVPKDTRRHLFEAGRSLRLLKDASDGMHPLCSGTWALEPSWIWGEGKRSYTDMRSHVRRVRKEIDHWRRSVRDRTKSISGSMSLSRLRGPGRKERKRLPFEFRQNAASLAESQTEVDVKIDTNPSSQSTNELGPLWALFDQVPGSHLEPKVDQSKILWAPNPLDELHAFIAKHSDPSHPLLPHDSPTLPLFISDYLLAPLLTHSTLVSTSLISLYFEDLQLLDHLDILRAYWLAGDVGFAERVSGALFGKEEAGAGEALGLGRRARTRVRLGLTSGDKQEVEGEWGIGLGLGLSERNKWPPGGSELAYALRTTLLEDEGGTVNKGPVWEMVEDRVSFAIKNLPEDEAGGSGRRAKWMDPQAIEALDFLYLSYSPPMAISTLLPSSLMEKYQSIHNLLLRLSRVDTVLRSVYWDLIHQSERSDGPLKIGVDSGFNRPPSRTSVQERTTHSLFPKDSKIERKVQRLRFRMNHFVSAFTRYILDVAIGTKWQVMRRRLGRLASRSPGKDGEGESEGGSRPSSPISEEYILNYEHFDDIDDEDDQYENGDGEEIIANLHQIQSIDSLVLYHQITMDKILHSALLGPQPGQQVTMKIFMSLLGLVLDFGKIIKEVQRGVRGWEDGAERVEILSKEWEEKEGIFLHALERLSLRTTTTKKNEQEGSKGTNTEMEHDMQVLLGGNQIGDSPLAGDTGVRSNRNSAGNDDLQELLLRLKLGKGSESRRGRWKDEAV